MEHPKAAWRVTSYEQVVDAVKIILKELNGGNRQDISEAIYETLRTEHRTLQQAFWSAMLMAQIDYSEMRTDARNEAAVELAKAVRDLAIERNIDRGLPYV
jgi:hypothetical protein